MSGLPKARGLVELIEATESWTVAETQLVKELLISLSNAHKAPELARWANRHPKKTLLVLGLLKTQTGFEILKGLDAIHKGAESKLVALSAASKNDPILKQIASRIDVIDRRQLLADIFTPERLARVNAAMSGAVDV
jgi:hypothetical protein